MPGGRWQAGARKMVRRFAQGSKQLRGRWPRWPAGAGSRKFPSRFEDEGKRMGGNAASRKMTSRFLNDGEQVGQGGRLLLLRTGRVRDCLQGRRRCGGAAASAAPPPAGKRAPAGGASAQGEAAGAAKCRLGHRKFKTLKEGNFRMGARHFGARESEVG